MLSLVLIVCTVILFFTIRKRKWYNSVISFLFFFLLMTECALGSVVYQNDTGYLQQQIDTLTTVNTEIEIWKETLDETLSDNPKLLNHLKDYLNEEIESNNTEILRCKNLQENRVKKYRWLLYFG